MSLHSQTYFGSNHMLDPMPGRERERSLGGVFQIDKVLSDLVELVFILPTALFKWPGDREAKERLWCPQDPREALHVTLKHQAKAEPGPQSSRLPTLEGSARCSSKRIIPTNKLKKALEAQISHWGTWKFFLQDNLLGRANWLGLTGLEIAILLSLLTSQ